MGYRTAIGDVFRTPEGEQWKTGRRKESWGRRSNKKIIGRSQVFFPITALYADTYQRQYQMKCITTIRQENRTTQIYHKYHQLLRLCRQRLLQCWLHLLQCRQRLLRCW